MAPRAARKLYSHIEGASSTGDRLSLPDELGLISKRCIL